VHAGPKVVGMRPEVLIVEYTDPSNVTFQFTLDNVLVVDALPVPIHISLKRMEDTLPEYYPLGNQIMNSGRRLAINEVPESFRNHPYWLAFAQPFMYGMSDTFAATQDYLRHQAQGSADAIVVAECQLQSCRTRIDLLRCSRCSRVYYCSREHQTEDWARHRRAECDRKPKIK
jgi:hypothetical protein